MLRKFKINGLGITDKEFNKLPFGRQVEFHKKIKEFKDRAKSTHVSQKRRSHAAAWREFKELYSPEEYYAEYEDGDSVRDDSFQVFYITKG